MPTDVAENMKTLERENRELRQAKEILTQGLGVICDAGARPPAQTMTLVHRRSPERVWVEPICGLLPVAPLTYNEHAAQPRSVADVCACPAR